MNQQDIQQIATEVAQRYEQDVCSMQRRAFANSVSSDAYDYVKSCIMAEVFTLNEQDKDHMQRQASSVAIQVAEAARLILEREWQG